MLYYISGMKKNRQPEIVKQRRQKIKTNPTTNQLRLWDVSIISISVWLQMYE